MGLHGVPPFQRHVEQRSRAVVKRIDTLIPFAGMNLSGLWETPSWTVIVTTPTEARGAFSCYPHSFLTVSLLHDTGTVLLFKCRWIEISRVIRKMSYFMRMERLLSFGVKLIPCLLQEAGTRINGNHSVMKSLATVSSVPREKQIVTTFLIWHRYNKCSDNLPCLNSFLPLVHSVHHHFKWSLSHSPF